MPAATVATYPATLPHDELVHLYRRMQGATVVSLLADEKSPFRQIAPLLVNRLCIAAHKQIIVDFHNSTLVIGLEAPFNTVKHVLNSCGKVFTRVFFNNVRTFHACFSDFAELFSKYLASQVSLEFQHCRNFPLLNLFSAAFKQAGVEFVNLKFRIGQLSGNLSRN